LPDIQPGKQSHHSDKMLTGIDHNTHQVQCISCAN